MTETQSLTCARCRSVSSSESSKFKKCSLCPGYVSDACGPVGSDFTSSSSISDDIRNHVGPVLGQGDLYDRVSDGVSIGDVDRAQGNHESIGHKS